MAQETFEQSSITSLDDNHKLIVGKGGGTSFFNITWLAIKNLLTSLFVPYSGAEKDVNLGDNILTAKNVTQTVLDAIYDADVINETKYNKVGATWTGSPYTSGDGANQGYLSTNTFDSRYSLQEFTDLNNVFNKLHRRKDDSTWSAWDKFLTANNFGATEIEELGFVPYTGATEDVDLSSVNLTAVTLNSKGSVTADGTTAVSSLISTKGLGKIAESFTPTGTSDTAGEFGSFAFGGDYIYYKSTTGWLRVKGEIF